MYDAFCHVDMRSIIHLLGLSERTDSTWTDYYMLLCDTTLLYFQSSKEREPTGVIVLRYATVTLEESKLMLHVSYIMYIGDGKVI